MTVALIALVCGMLGVALALAAQHLARDHQAHHQILQFLSQPRPTQEPK